MEASEGLPARHSSSPRVRPVGCGPARHHDPGDRHRTRDSGRAWRGGQPVGTRSYGGKALPARAHPPSALPGAGGDKRQGRSVGRLP